MIARTRIRIATRIKAKATRDPQNVGIPGPRPTSAGIPFSLWGSYKLMKDEHACMNCQIRVGEEMSDFCLGTPS